MSSKHSVYTPFLRRFTDERARDLSETIALYNEVRGAHLASAWANKNAIENTNAFIADCVGKVVDLPNSQSLMTAFDLCQQKILTLETTIFTSPEIDWSRAVLSMKEQVDLRRFLRAQQHFLANADRISELLATALSNVFAGLVTELPNIPSDAGNPTFTIPLVSLLRDPGDVVDRLIGTIYTEALADAGLFATLQDRLYENICTASGVMPGKEIKKPLITANQSELAPVALVETYLKGTPFLNLLLAPVPFSFTDEQRYEHMHVIGGSGHGKTQLLQHLIVHDLQKDKAPSLIIIDSQGEMLRKIEWLKSFSTTLADKLILIDPEDVAFPPALNMFDVASGRTKQYSQAIREQLTAGIIELYNYIFGAIAAEMTSRQSTAFTFVTRLMLTIEGATIHTLLELMEDRAKSVEESKFAQDILKLDPTSQAYFRNQFFTKAYADLRGQVARRLYSVISVPAFDRMFSAKDNKLDLFDAMQNGKIVLINTSKAFLKSDASSLFGRFAIALTLRAAFERVAGKHRPAAFLIIDEASDYFDESLEPLLSQARKFNLGVLFAHQHLDQLTKALRSSVAANTTIKLAGGVSDHDARALAPDLRTTTDFIASMKKHARSTEFACYVRNYTGNAVRLDVPFLTLERALKMSEADHDVLIARNRARYAVSPEPPRPSATGPDDTRTPNPVPSAGGKRPPQTEITSTEGDDWRS